MTKNYESTNGFKPLHREALVKRILIGMAFMISISAFGIDCTLTDSSGNKALFSNADAWNGTMAGSADVILSTHGLSGVSKGLLKKLSPYDLIIQRKAGDDLYRLDSGKYFKLVLFRDQSIIASTLSPMEYEKAVLPIPELNMTLECKPTKFADTIL